MDINNFEKLASVNVNDKIEKKNGLSYLSWAWAVDQLMRHDPAASWSYGDPVTFGSTVMVVCTVTAFNKPMTMQLPVMDHRNKAISNPDAFAVNTAMQRCLVKAIALHGLGLYIYAGEDLPLVDDEAPAKLTAEQIRSLDAKINEVGADKAAFLKFAKVESLADIMASDYPKAIAALEKKREAA